MSNIDDRIRSALSHDEEAHLDPANWDEPGLIKQSFDVLRGRHRFITTMSMIMIFVFVALAFVAGYQFFTVEDQRAMLMWGFVAFFAFQAVGLLKMWFYMQMDKNTLLREIKRLELQIARLAEKHRDAE